MLFPLKKQITAILLLLGILSYSQRLQDKKYELILTELIENETGFDPTMKMSTSKQYFYEGAIIVTSKDNGEEKKYNFFFAVWNDKCKGFTVKDNQYNIIKPKVYFKDKIAMIKKGKEIVASIDLKGELQVEKYILSCMLFWLNQKDVENGTVVAN
jgi:hypothetical protein